MSYSCLEELQVDLDLHMLDKTAVLSKVGRMYDNKWFVVTDDGHCHLFDNYGNLDDIKKITCLNERHIKKNITKIVIPDSVTSIGYRAFFWCNGLTSVTIPVSVTSIMNFAFFNCSYLTNIIITNYITNIGNYAFAYCIRLTNVTIPDSVTYIGGWAFYHCNNLISLTFKDKTLEQVKMIDNYPWGIEDESIIRVE